MKYFLVFTIFLSVLTLNSCGSVETKPYTDKIIPSIYRCTFYLNGKESFRYDYQAASIGTVNEYAAAVNGLPLSNSYECYLLIE